MFRFEKPDFLNFIIPYKTPKSTEKFSCQHVQNFPKKLYGVPNMWDKTVEIVPFLEETPEDYQEKSEENIL